MTQVVGPCGEGEVGAVFPGLGWTCRPHTSPSGKTLASHLQPIAYLVDKTWTVLEDVALARPARMVLVTGLCCLPSIRTLESEP